jgi:hypothetical protein
MILLTLISLLFNIPILPNSNLQPVLQKVVPTPIVEILEEVILPCRQTVKGTQNIPTFTLEEYPNLSHYEVTPDECVSFAQFLVTTQPYLLHNIDFMF